MNSIISQTYQELDIILVDDGSTDNSAQICDTFAASEKRIRVIHQTNKGLSGARNAGLDIAREVRKDDWDSEILFITNHDKMYDTVYESLFKVFCFIRKFHNKFQVLPVESL